MRTAVIARSVATKIPWGWIATKSEARLRFAETTQPGDDDVARSSFRRTDRYPHAYCRNFHLVGTEPFGLAGDVAVARQGREDVQAQRRGRQCGRACDAVRRPQAQGRDPDRPKLSDHHDPGGGAGWVLAAPRPATAEDRKPCGRSGLDRNAAAAQAGQDGPARRRGAAAGASRLQAR